MVVLVVLASLAAAVGLIGSVGAAAGPPATPTITSGPSGNVATTSATFKFSDTTSGVTYLCALDSGAFKACATTGVTYSGLANGTHTFKVEATKSNVTSSPVARTWTVDTTGPTVALAFPSNLHTYGTGTWNTGCAAGPGICGTSTDPSGVASVRVGVLSLSTLRYWNGTSFSSGGQFLLTASGLTSWRLPMPVPPTGLYAVLASATDALGNVRSVAQILLFSVSTTAPPAPSITAKPAISTALTSATFKFTDTKSGVTFQCTRDSATATPCTSPITYSSLASGSHCFSVVAVDSYGNTSSPASYCWTITSSTPPAPPAPTISGKPTATTTQPGATFTFSDTQSGVTFKCSLDSATPTPCTSPISYSNLDVTGHCFSVFAIDTLNQVSPTTQYCWTINGVAFTINGSLAGPFSPGVTQPVNLSIVNPNNFAIKVTAVTVTVNDATIKTSLPNPACVGSTNVVVSQTFSGPVTVGPNATLVVPAGQSPTLKMLNLSTNQDACKGTTFQFGFTGTAILP